MRFAGYQPQYFPRLHYMNRVLDSDVFEISDYVQFVKKHQFPLPDGTKKAGKSYQADTPIKLGHGKFDLTIPVHEGLTPINKTPISYSRSWQRDHLRSIESAYGKAPNFRQFFPELQMLLEKEYHNLAALTIQTVFWSIIRMLTDDPLRKKPIAIATVEMYLTKKHPFRLRRVFLASSSPVPPPQKGGANDWIIALCRYAQADEYYYGETSHTAYMDIQKFKDAGIKLVLQNWQQVEYKQQFPKIGFIPNLSVIDLVMNQSLEDRQRAILGG